MMSPSNGKEIISFDRLLCKHGRKLLDCKTDPNKNMVEVVADDTQLPKPKANPKMVVIENLLCQDIQDDPSVLKNIRGVNTIYIIGNNIVELKEDLVSQFQNISLTASVHKAKQLESTPEVL